MAGANSNIQLTGLDFDEIKTNLKLYLQSQEVLKDANYEGSVLSILLDILAYNTHYNAHYLNMIGNEMFLDTSVKRSSVVSHAKSLGYTPYSYSAPTAEIEVSFYDVTTDQIIIPKYSKFVTNQIDGKIFTFVTTDESIIKTDKTNNTAKISGLTIKQGEPNFYSYTYSQKGNPTARFKIPDKNIDLSTLSVVVQNSSININSEVFRPTKDFLTLDGDSRVYFIEETYDGYYEIYFGDGALGKKLTDGNLIYLNYLSVSSDIYNNIGGFSLVSPIIGDYGTKLIATLVTSYGGRFNESIDSIKYNSPKFFASQGRAVTINDYSSLIMTNSGELPIDAVTVWSGEENDPPVFGKIFISVKPKGGFTLTENQKQKLIEDIIKPISVLTVNPVVVDIDYSYLNIVNNVLYDRTKTILSQEELRTQIIARIKDYAITELGTFNSTLVLPEINSQVNQSNPSIITNESIVYLEKRIYPVFNSARTYTMDFGVALKRDFYRNSIKFTPSLQMYDSTNDIIREEVFIEEVPTSATSIESIEITNSGFNYTSVPTVTIYGDGTGATAHAEITNGKVTKIVIDSSGINYTQASVVISGGNGYLASAKASLQNKYGNLRSYYFVNSNKVVLNSNVGTVDYINGIITLEDFNPYEINNSSGILSVFAVPDSSIVYSKRNKMLIMDRNDVNAVKVNISTK